MLHAHTLCFININLNFCSVPALEHHLTPVYVLAELDIAQQSHYVELQRLRMLKSVSAKLATYVPLSLVEYVLRVFLGFRQAQLQTVPNLIA